MFTPSRNRGLCLMQCYVLMTVITLTNAIYVTNITKPDKNIIGHENPADWTEDGIWSPLLEEWALRSTDQRNSRQMTPLSQGNYYITERIDETDAINDPSKRPPGKVISKPISNRPREVSETDLYLLGAIEKLVYRVDFMEKRLRRTEEMLYYLMAGNVKNSEPCTENFTRAGENCYHFGISREINWKSANAICRSLGATLAEMETIVENQDVVSHLQNNSHLKGKDYWTGGLNPGLLWIWSNSARPVSNGNSTTAMDKNKIEIKGTGRCLKLGFNPALKSYSYQGQDCSKRHHYICEIQDKSVSNEISRMSKNLYST